MTKLFKGDHGDLKLHPKRQQGLDMITKFESAYLKDAKWKSFSPVVDIWKKRLQQPASETETVAKVRFLVSRVLHGITNHLFILPC